MVHLLFQSETVFSGISKTVEFSSEASKVLVGMCNYYNSTGGNLMFKSKNLVVKWSIQGVGGS